LATLPLNKIILYLLPVKYKHMKKIALLFLIGAVVASCAKKMAPSANQAPAANNGVVIATTNPAPVATVPKAATADVTPVAEPTAASAKPARAAGELSVEQKGQSTYNAKCGRCHGLKATTDYTVNRWVTVMQVMAVKANLNDEEKENVLAYVKANAKK
jgi:mono/diheme cytochrome c family protein